MKRFWDSVDVKGPDDCWLWKGTIYIQGYGRFRNNGCQFKAHRVSFELTNGKIPEGKVICHMCDVKHCVNPKHLFIGTQQDNIRDMVKKRRHSRHSQTHCKRGHEFTPENTRIHSTRGSRECRACNLIHSRNHRAKLAHP